MTYDLWFRAILGVLAIALYLNHHVLHRSPAPKNKRVAPSLQSLDFWVFGAAWLWATSLVLYVAGVGASSLAAPLPQWVRGLGVVAMVLCIPLSQWIYRSLGVHFSKKLELREDHKLVQEGPYAYVRHPMYSTLFLCAIATCLISANYAVIATTLAVATLMLLRIQKEEDMMLERFGQEYQQYRRQTGALLPKLLQ